MTTAKLTSIQERSRRSYAILAEDLMERDVCSCGGGDALSTMVKQGGCVITLWPCHFTLKKYLRAKEKL